MYADDTRLLSTLQTFKSNHSSNSLYYNINAELTKITQWLALNRLSLYAKKTKIMIFQQNKLIANEIPIIKINGMPIERVTLFKQLGLLKAADIFKLACFKLLYKCKNSKLPIYFNAMFVLQHDNVVIRPGRIHRAPQRFNSTE